MSQDTFRVFVSTDEHTFEEDGTRMFSAYPRPGRFPERTISDFAMVIPAILVLDEVMAGRLSYTSRTGGWADMEAFSTLFSKESWRMAQEWGSQG